MAGKLKPLEVARQITPGKYADGGGLYFIVAGPTSRNWSYRYWKDGKERWHGLGSFKDVSLAEARLKRDAARLTVKGDRSTAGVDIVAAKRSAREEAKAIEVAVAAPTFQECAERYIDDNWSKWSKKHRAQRPSSLNRYAYPTIGTLTIAEIRPSHIFDLLAPIWVSKCETANRVRGRIETIIAKNVDVDNTDFAHTATAQTSSAQSEKPIRGNGTAFMMTAVAPAGYGPWTSPNPGQSSSLCGPGQYQIGVEVIGAASSVHCCVGCVGQLRAVCQQLP